MPIKSILQLNTLVRENIKLSLERQKGRFSISIGTTTYQQNVCEFLLTVSFLSSHNTEEHLLNPSPTYDFVKVPLKGNGQSVRLALSEFARLKELYHHQMYLLKLEDMLLRQGVSLS